MIITFKETTLNHGYDTNHCVLLTELKRSSARAFMMNKQEHTTYTYRRTIRVPDSNKKCNLPMKKKANGQITTNK